MQYVLYFFITFCFSSISQASSDIKESNGEALFNKHGCTNCHGNNGIHPTSNYIPVLKGKQIDYLIKKANAIFNGEHFSNKTRFMHEQFCIGNKLPDEGCYPIPDIEEIKAIAQWLGSDLPKKKKTPQKLYVSAQQAYEKLEKLGDKALFIDIRTRAEIAFLGMPTNIDANIPYLKAGDFSEWNERSKNFKLYPNSQFINKISELLKDRNLSKSSPIFLICRSGSRSAKASKLMYIAGYTNVYSVVDGFEGDKAKEGPLKGQRAINGWKNSKLPWSYKLKHDLIFF